MTSWRNERGLPDTCSAKQGFAPRPNGERGGAYVPWGPTSLRQCAECAECIRTFPPPRGLWGCRIPVNELKCIMTTNETARSQGMSFVWSGVFRAVRLLIFGLIGWFWFISAADFIWKAVSLAALLAVAA